MIALLIQLLIICVCFGVVYWIITLIPLPHPFALIAQVVLALVLLFVLLNLLLGLPFGGGHLLRY